MSKKIEHPAQPPIDMDRSPVVFWRVTEAKASTDKAGFYALPSANSITDIGTCKDWITYCEQASHQARNDNTMISGSGVWDVLKWVLGTVIAAAGGIQLYQLYQRLTADTYISVATVLLGTAFLIWSLVTLVEAGTGTPVLVDKGVKDRMAIEQQLVAYRIRLRQLEDEQAAAEAKQQAELEGRREGKRAPLALRLSRHRD